MAANDVTRQARQIGWAAAALAVVGLVLAVTGQSGLGGALIAIGFLGYVAMQYIAARYR